MLRKGATQQEISIAQSQVAAAQAQLSKLRKGVKPQELNIAQGQIEKAESMVLAIQNQLQEAVVRAPISGTISLLNVHAGELVSPGQAVLAVMDDKNLWCDVYLPESKRHWLKTKDTVDITLDSAPDKRFSGQVLFISPQSEFVPNGTGAASQSQEATFRVKMALNRRDEAGTTELSPGLKVTVHLKSPESKIGSTDS